MLRTLPDFLATPDRCAVWGTCKTCIPSIHAICAPLLGNSTPLLVQRILIFRVGIEAVSIKGDATDLLTLAGHRLLVTKHIGLPIDQLLVELGERLSVDWAELARRLPSRAPARAECLARAQARVPEPV